MQMVEGDILDDRGAHRGVTVTLQDVFEGLRRFKQLSGVKHLVVIGHIPTLHGINLYEEMTRPVFAQSGTLEAHLAPQPLDTRYRELNDGFRAEALKSGDFVFLDPCDALCAEALCDGIDENGQPIYSDGYHLSKCGSRRVIRAFLPQLRAVLEARDRDP
jgi:hypothetical protein